MIPPVATWPLLVLPSVTSFSADDLCLEVSDVKFALLTGDETPDELRELVTNLRERQRRTPITSIRDEIDSDINEALDLLAATKKAAS